MIDPTLLGVVAAECMDALEGVDGELVAVGVVVVVADEEGTVTRAHSSCEFPFQQIGLFSEALSVLQSHIAPVDPE